MQCLRETLVLSIIKLGILNINKFNRKQDNNAIVKQAYDEILLQKNNKVSAQEESHQNIESDFGENNLYQIGNMSLDNNKENIEWSKRAFECEPENEYEIEIRNGMTCIHVNKVNK